MKKLYKKGFTLIELLIVIAILSILAVGLIATLDPLEQVNRATDTARKATATDLIHAADRFYASHQSSVACNYTSTNSTCTNTPVFANSLSDTGTVKLSTLTQVNATLNGSGETKSATSFTTNPQAANIEVGLANTTTPAAATLVVCWKPVSKAQKTFARPSDITSTIYLPASGGGIPQMVSDANQPSQCPASPTNPCYQCVVQQ